MKQLKYTFAYPHNELLSVPFHESIVAMLFHELAEKPREECNLGSMMEAGSCHVPFNRNTLCGTFLDKFTDDYIVMIDTDVQFPANVLTALNSHIYILGEIFPVWDRKYFPHIIAGRVDIGNGMPVFYKRMGLGEYKHDPRPFNGLKHFDAIGTGIVAISRWCLQTILNETRSYHFFNHLAEAGKLMSDDFSFCYLAREHGFLPYGAWDIKGIHAKRMFIKSSYYESLDEYEKFKREHPSDIPEWLKDEGFIISDKG